MIEISREEAFLEFESWSKDSLVGLNFGRKDGGVSFSLRKASLEVKSPSLLLEVKGTSISLLYLDGNVYLARLTPEDVAAEFARLREIEAASVKNCIGVKFANEDFCFLFEEQ